MTKDLTKGKIMPLLVGFTIPLVLGNLFQLTYNAVDSIIVGQFVGKEALAAVGICNPVMTLMILFLNGLCMGASILMGTQYGAKDYDKLHRQISTTMLSGVVFSIILSLICIIFSVPILHILQVDSSIIMLTTATLVSISRLRFFYHITRLRRLSTGQENLVRYSQTADRRLCVWPKADRMQDFTFLEAGLKNVTFAFNLHQAIPKSYIKSALLHN